MIVEAQILRAYALASQKRYEDAIRILEGAPDALATRSGVELLARIKLEQGEPQVARRIWAQLLQQYPADDVAKRAIDTLDHGVLPHSKKYYCWVIGLSSFVAAFVIGLCAAFFCNSTPPATIAEQAFEASKINSHSPSIIAEQTLEIAKINGKVLSELRNGILTNVTDKTVLAISGGRGKYATERMRNLSVIADCVKESTGMSFEKMLLQVGDEQSENVRIVVMENFLREDS